MQIMRLIRVLVTSLVIATSLAIATGGLAANAATGDAYEMSIDTAFSSHPVYVDPKASPTITVAEATKLDNQIKATGKPIYLALINNSETKHIASPSAFLEDVHSGLGANSSEVIAVSTSKGFYANGYNLPAAVANGAGDAAQNVASNVGSPANYYNAYSKWIAQVASIKTGSSSNTSSSTNATSGVSVFWVVFWIIFGVVVLGIIITIITVAARSSRRRYDNSYSGYSSSSYSSGSRNQSSGVYAQNSDGEKVFVSPTTYRPQSNYSDAYPHYYGGGTYGGNYYGPGYYGMNFWDFLLLDEIIDQNNEYDRGGYNQPDNNYSPDVSSGTTGGDTWGGDDLSSSSSSPDTSSWDGGFDTGTTSGGDWGGGGSFDSGSNSGGDGNW